MTKNFNPTFGEMKSKSAVGYSAFPMDHLVNFTSAAGYLIPVYWDFLSPGDKVNMKTLLRTQSQPLTKPAMATCIERIEWFAVPIDQLYKPFSSKFYGINDISTDLLPTSGYDDYLPYMSLLEMQAYMKGLPETPYEQSQQSVANPMRMDAMRLCESLGLPRNLGADFGGNEWQEAGISALPFAAYQKIYFDHYRLTDRFDNDPKAYNLDSFNGSSQGISAKVTSDRFPKLLMLRKRPYMRDYFTSMHVSPLFGSQDVNASGTDLGRINQWLNGLSRVSGGISSPTGVDAANTGYLASAVSNPTSVRIPSVNTTEANFNVVSGMLNPANIRSLFAVEKLLEVTRRSKKHYDMQTLAHFGVDVPKGLSGECMKLGTFEQFLRIGEVVSTSNTAEGSLGELAGRGSSEGMSKNFDFEAKCHCVLMAIYSVEPVVNYTSAALDRLVTMTNASDFYKSEFDNLGLQPVFRKELHKVPVSSTAPANLDNVVIGWQPRYEQLKAKYNRSFAGCASDSFEEWSLNRTPLKVDANLSRNFFEVWPTDLNNILLTPYQYSSDVDTNYDIYAQDYFVNQIYFDVQKASKMSVFGVPNL